MSKFLIIKPTRYTNFSKIYFGMKLYMFRTIPLSIIGSFSLYTRQWCMSYRFANTLRAGSGWNILILLADVGSLIYGYTATFLLFISVLRPVYCVSRCTVTFCEGGDIYCIVWTARSGSAIVVNLNLPVLCC